VAGVPPIVGALELPLAEATLMENAGSEAVVMPSLTLIRMLR
jgi:hypothetical protein